MPCSAPTRFRKIPWMENWEMSMKLIHCICLVFCMALRLNSVAGSGGFPLNQSDLDGPGIGYTENKGQIRYADGTPANDVLFVSEESGVRVYVRAEGFSFVFSDLSYPENAKDEISGAMDFYQKQLSASLRSFRFDLDFTGANPDAQVITETPLGTHRNFYLPTVAPEGIRDVKTYQKVTLKDLYPGIDLFLYSKGGMMKYDFIVHPGADPSQIQMQGKGLQSLTLNSDGSLDLISEAGIVREAAPVCFQEGEEVSGSYLVKGDRVSFDIPRYNPEQELVIDPIRIWATYFGASSNEGGESVSIANDGKFYLFGSSASTDLPITTGAFQATHAGGTWDIYLSCFSEGGQVEWITYMGGSGADNGTGGMDVDSSGNVYIQGITLSSDFPVSSNPFQSTSGGSNDVFFASFDSSGARRWATYIGGSNFEDSKGGVTVDHNQDILFYGNTSSSNFPVTPNAYQVNNAGSNDVYLTKFRSDGTQIWGTLFGGSVSETGQSGIAVDARNNIYIGGETSSSDLPLRNAYQASFAGFRDAFIAKFTPDGDSLIWSTYYGGFSWDFIAGKISTDETGSVYVAGQTLSSNFPTSPGAQQTVHGGAFDAFAMRFDSVGNRVWATFLGGSSSDYGEGGIIAIDSNDIVMTGATGSGNFPVTPDAFQGAYANGSDAFLVRLNSQGQMTYGTFIGGTATETYPADIDIAPDETVVLSGYTSSTNFPVTANAWQGSYGGGVFDAYLIKFTLCRLESSIAAPDSLCDGDNTGMLDLNINGGSAPFSYLWTSGDTTEDVANVGAGAYNVTVLDSYGCETEDSVSIHSLPSPNLQIGNDTTICEGDTLILTGGPGWSQYLWSDSSTGSTLSAFSTELYYLEVTDSSGCRGRDSVDLIVQSLPILTLGPDTSICRGDTLYLDGGNGNFSYNWSTGSTQRILKVFETGMYSGIIQDSVGCQNSDSIDVGINELPSVTVFSYGPATICIDDTLVLEASPATYSSYDWNNGDSGPVAHATTGGLYRVTVIDSNQCQVSSTINVQYLPFPDPDPQIIPSGFVEICNGTSLPVDAGQGYFAYDWNTGDVSQVLSVNSTGQYWVTVTNGFGCTEISDTLDVAVLNPINPMISVVGNTLETVPGSTYQWYRNNSPIPGANAIQYLATQNGTYKVDVTNVNGCLETSPDYAFVLNGIEGSLSGEISIWPNPSSGRIFLELPELIGGLYHIDLYDVRGKLVFESEQFLQAGENSLNFEEVSEGAYFLRVHDGELQWTGRLLLN